MQRVKIIRKRSSLSRRIILPHSVLKTALGTITDFESVLHLTHRIRSLFFVQKPRLGLSRPLPLGTSGHCLVIGPSYVCSCFPLTAVSQPDITPATCDGGRSHRPCRACVFMSVCLSVLPKTASLMPREGESTPIASNKKE